MKALLRAFIGAISLLWVGSVLGATTALYFKSQPGDYIGGGQEKLFMSGEFTFNANKNYHNGVGFGVRSAIGLDGLVVSGFCRPTASNPHCRSL